MGSVDDALLAEPTPLDEESKSTGTTGPPEVDGRGDTPAVPLPEVDGCGPTPAADLPEVDGR